jgi:hypothetical protein
MICATEMESTIRSVTARDWKARDQRYIFSVITNVIASPCALSLDAGFLYQSLLRSNRNLSSFKDL